MSHENDVRSPRYVASVSYPRSGHSMTVRIVRRYFGSEFRFCEFYNDYHGDCCKSFPCTNPAVSFTKNHDFDLTDPANPGIPKLDGVPYLVMVRNFLETTVSGYNLFLRRNPDTPETWQRYVRLKLQHYRRFVHKWVLSDDSIEKVVVRYEDLTADPASVLKKVLTFFHPPEPVNDFRLRRLIDSVEAEDTDAKRTKLVEGSGVRATRRIEDFQHFDPDFFQALEKELADEFSGLGYSRRYAA